MHIVCPECGAKNRVPENRQDSRSYRCGRCGVNLSGSGATPHAGPIDDIVGGPRVESPKPPHAAIPRGRIGRVLPLLHPYFFAAFFVLTLYAANATEVKPSEVVVPLIGSLGVALLVTPICLVVAAAILRRRRSPRAGPPTAVWDWTKATLLSSLFLVLFFSFGHVLIWAGGWDTLHRTVLPNDRWLELTIIWLLLLGIAGAFIILTRKDLRRFALALTLVGAAMVAVATVNVIINETNASEPGSDLTDFAPGKASMLSDSSDLPDIYYIILDRYGSATTLNDMWGFDNSDFMDYLSGKGFFIASESVANYPFTTRSLTSSLNMGYIHEGEVVEPVSGNLQDYRVWRFLKEQGYEFIHFGSWWEPTRQNPYADLNINYYAMPEFSWFFFQTTWAYPLGVFFEAVDDWVEIQYDRALYKFDELAKIPAIEGPTFVFAHMLVPHPPFVFRADGTYRNYTDAVAVDMETQYLEQLEATNNMLMRLIDRLLEDSETSPVIILQSDEGPRHEEQIIEDPSWSIATAGDEELQEKMRILNAYLLPDIDNSVLYPSISPVNSFRLIFDAYFGAGFEFLPDRSYVNAGSGTYIDVTDRVKYGD